MNFPAFGEFVSHLESIGELRRIPIEVDPVLEITEIAYRALKEKKPALFFEKVKGSKYPLVINAFASERRIELALGKHPQQIGEELFKFADLLIPPTRKAFWSQRSLLKRILFSRPKNVANGFSQDIVEEPNLNNLPVQKCWPLDGGRFFTLPQVFTYDPVTGNRNVGMYRMQVFDERTTGMHWQIERGGGVHYKRACEVGGHLDVTVALGTAPALLIATISALPEGIDEVMFASFLGGRNVPLVKGKTISISVPAEAEFILEGYVPVSEKRLEGPFGDHFGHYSKAAMFPVFHIKKITHRKNPIYPATVVGIPPMEDKFLGNATQEIMGPLARLIHREVTDMWAYYEAGFHNLLVVAVDERYHKEAMKAAFGLLGTGQLSLTKCLILVSQNVDVRDWKSVLNEIRDNFDPHFDFLLLNKVPLDTLDFTSFTMELGSKMIIDATRKNRTTEKKEIKISKKDIQSIDRRILDINLIDETLLIVKVNGGGGAILVKLLNKKSLQDLKMIAVVSDDVDIYNQENYIWGIFTRFDCERDIKFSKQKLIGISPIYEGTLGIDATWKKGYPASLRMPAEIVKKVDDRWKEYWD